jgi:hypothetical protein
MTKYRTLKVIVTRLGKHRPGELGVGYNSQSDGLVNFFPDGGGFAIVPVSALQRVDPRATKQRVASPLPFSLLEKQVSGETRKVRRVVKRTRRVVRRILRN